MTWKIFSTKGKPERKLKRKDKISGLIREDQRTEASKEFRDVDYSRVGLFS